MTIQSDDTANTGITGITEPSVMPYRLRSNIGTLSVTRQMMLDAADEIERLTDELQDERDNAGAWPDWAMNMYRTLEGYGVEFDTYDGVDLPQEFADWCDGFVRAERETRERLATSLTKIEALSDRCVNEGHYTAKDALDDLQAIRHWVKQAFHPVAVGDRTVPESHRKS